MDIVPLLKNKRALQRIVSLGAEIEQEVCLLVILSAKQEVIFSFETQIAGLTRFSFARLTICLSDQSLCKVR